MLEIIVCEDNDTYREIVIENLRLFMVENKISGSLVLDTASPQKVLEFIGDNNNSPNVFFLDIDLNAKLSGLDIASLIHEKYDDVYIVFISQYTNLVFKSFKVRPFDFLPKPVTKKALGDVLMEINQDYLKKHETEKPGFLGIKIGAKIYQIPKKDIAFMEKYGNKCIVHAKNKTIYCYHSLDAIYDKLQSPDFIRCHKSYIVNKNFIGEINLSAMEIILANGQKCFIGGKYKKNLIEETENILQD